MKLRKLTLITLLGFISINSQNVFAANSGSKDDAAKELSKTLMRAEAQREALENNEEVMEFKRRLDEARNRAITNPTKANVAEYKRLESLMFDYTTEFGKAWVKSNQTHNKE